MKAHLVMIQEDKSRKLIATLHLFSDNNPNVNDNLVCFSEEDQASAVYKVVAVERNFIRKNQDANSGANYEAEAVLIVLFLGIRTYTKDSLVFGDVVKSQD